MDSDKPALELLPAGPAGASAPAGGDEGRGQTRVLPAWMLGLLVGMGVLYTAHFARALLIPVAFSLLLSMVLAPGVRMLCALRIPRTIAAALMVVVTLTGSAALIGSLAGPAQSWLERAPAAASRIEKQLREWRKPLAAASSATERVMSIAQGDAGRKAAPVVMAATSPMEDMLKSAPALITSVIASVFLIFLLLMHGDTLLRKCVTALPNVHAKRDFVAATREVQQEFSNYLLTISAINLGLGVAVAVALSLVGVPDPVLWGGAVALLNFAPYVGPTLAAAVLVLVGYSDPADTVHALTPALVFLCLHGIESQVITPLLVGRRLALDPVVIFLSLMLFGWLWGMAGLLMAVPLLTCLKVVAQHLWPDARWLQLMTQRKDL